MPIQIMSYPEETKKVAGKDEKLSSLPADDVEVFDETIKAIAYQNSMSEPERKAILDNEDLILDLVRMVNTNTKQGFAGPYARGNELTIVVMRAKDFLNQDTWLKTYTSTGSTVYRDTVTMDDYHGELHLGVSDAHPNPKVDAILYTKDGDPIVRKHLDWEDMKVPFIPFEQPIIVGPNHSVKTEVNVNQVGNDMLKILAIKVVPAKDLLSL